MQFATNDVVAVARAVLENPLYEIDHGYNSYQYCQFCASERNIWPDSAEHTFPHEQNCPTLIAKDILTGLKDHPND